MTIAIAADLLESVSTALENADPVPPLVGTAVGFALLSLGWRFRGASDRSLMGLILAGAAAFAALVAALYASDLSWGLPPKVFRDWTIAATGLGVLVGVLVGGGPLQRAAGVALGAGTFVYLFAVPTESLHERYWNGQVTLHVAGLSGAALLALLVRLGQGAQARTTEGMLAFAISASMAAPAVGLTGTGVSAGLAGALAGGAGLFGLLQAAIPRLREHAGPFGRAAGSVQVMALAGVLATGVLYADTPKWAGAMILLAPCLTLLPGKSTPMAVLRLTLVGAVCAVPVIVVLLNQEPPNPYGGY